MNNKMIKRTSIALLMLFPLPAFAQGYVVTPLPNGGIKAVSVTSVTDWVLAQGFADLPMEQTDRATAVILEEGKPPRLAFDTLEEIDRRFNGDGAVDLSGQVIHLEDADGNLDKPAVISLDDIPEGVPIELFENDGPNYIALRDGQWRTEIVDVKQTGCPAQIVPMIKQMVGGGAITNVKFSTPYHPTDFSEQLDFATWKKISPNGWVSEPFSPLGAGQNMPPGMEFSIKYTMIATSKEQLSVWSRVQLTLPGIMSAIAGGSTKCIAEGRGYYKYAG